MIALSYSMNPCIKLFPSYSFTVKQQGLAILYHLISLKSLDCLTFPLWMKLMPLVSGYKFLPIWFRTEK